MSIVKSLIIGTLVMLSSSMNGMNEKEKQYIRDMKIVKNLREQQTINRLLEQRINALSDRVNKMEKEEKAGTNFKK